MILDKYKKYLPVIGSKFTSLMVLALAGKSKDGKKSVLCICDCGKYRFVTIKSLKSKNTKSCGCSRLLHLKTVNIKHKMSYTKTYKSWRGVIERTTNINSKDYRSYGGRGITVCERWLKFENFYADMGERPEGTSIDRLDNNKGYSKENCKWSTSKEQSNNRRSSKLITYNGVTATLTEWASILGIKMPTLSKRLSKYKWTIEKAFTVPVN